MSMIVTFQNWTMMDSDNEAALLVLMERTGYPMLQVCSFIAL